MRPFKTIDDLIERLGQGRKKAGPAGISPRLFDDCVEIYRGYNSVDNVLEGCERIGLDIRTTIASWAQLVLGKGKSRELAVVKSTAVDDLFEDGALNLHGISLGEGSGKILIKAPSLVSTNVQLKDYQILGVNWLFLLYTKRLSCILADEMGTYLHQNIS